MEEITLISLQWVLLAVVAFAAGYFVVQYMVQPTEQIGLYVTLLMLVLAGIVFLLIMNFKGREIVIASLLVLGGFVCGYMGANWSFLSQQEKRELPKLVRNDGGDGHTAILYFTHGEPPGYSAQPWIETIRELDHDNVPFVPWLFRPFFFNAAHAEYFEAVGAPTTNFIKCTSIH
jgi:hypothetical protein